jgi:dTDP-4-dehydrorhamnose reductase
MKTKIALTGQSGLVGSRITELLASDYEFVSIPQEEIDITDRKSVFDRIHSIDFDILFHLAAYTNVDQAEIQKDICRKVNVDGTKNLYEAVTEKGKKMIYVSTGFVFDGINPPFDETSAPHPLSYYAKTKYEGEQIVKDTAMIVRFDYPYRKSYTLKRDFVAGIKYALEQKKDLNMVTDSLFTPTFIDDIAYAMNYLFSHFQQNIYHIVGSNSISPYDAAIQIADVCGLDKKYIHQTNYATYYAGKAPRPQRAVITSVHNSFYPMKSFRNGLEACFSK